MNRRLAIPMLVVVLACVAGSVPPQATATEGDGRAEQVRIEGGRDLGSRAQAVLQRARNRQDEGDFAAAAELVRGWLAGDPARAHHLWNFNLARSLLGLEQTEAALAELERAVEREPRFGRAWLLLGQTAYAQQRYLRAAEAFLRASGLLSPSLTELPYYAATAYLQAGRPAAALPLLEELLADGASPENRADLARYRALVTAAVESGQADRARPYLDRLLSRRPSEPEAWDLAYRFAAGQDDLRTAAVCLTVRGYLQPLTPRERRQQGDLYAAIGVPRQAARFYEMALADGGDDPVGHERVAAAWLAAHEPRRARQALRAGLATAETARLWSLLGDLEYQSGHVGAAMDAFARCCDRDPSDGRAWLMRGWCAREMGRDADARVFLERAAAHPEHRRAARKLLERLRP